MKLRLLELLFLLLAVSDQLPVRAATPLVKVLVTTGSASEREGALYVAQDQGFFRRNSAPPCRRDRCALFFATVVENKGFRVLADLQRSLFSLFIVLYT